MALGLFVSVSALASEQQLSDLNFIQKSSTFLLDSGVNYNQNSNGGTKTTGISLDNKFTYGMSDRFNTGLSLAYMFSYKSKTSAGSSENETGLSDVTLNNQYRLGQTSDGLVIDLLADLRISTKEREINGDAMLPVNEGRHSLNVGLNLGRKTSGFEWRTKAALKYNDAIRSCNTQRFKDRKKFAAGEDGNGPALRPCALRLDRRGHSDGIYRHRRHSQHRLKDRVRD
jgi:hypothetical protein